uniref:LO7 protein n=1 Tax=Retropinna adomavirus 3 TaxID=3064108 RepID=A0AA49X5L9_9VIRU|nr:MAG: LO7 protein [Retropinna adomavirus 3]
MTSNTEDGAYDEDLSFCIQDNQTEYHVAAVITSRVHTREGQITNGPTLTQQLNTAGTSDVIIDLQCPADEAICVGSICFHARGRVRVFTIADNAEVVNWQSMQHNQQAFFAAGEAVAVNNGVGSVMIPCFIMNSQFQSIDIELGQTQSLNAHLPQTRASEFGAGAMAILNHYLNEPHDSGYHCLNDTTMSGHMNHRSKLSVTAHGDEVEVIEKVHHQLNTPYNVLCTWDLDDHDIRKTFPRGLCLRLRACTRDVLDRCHLRNNVVANNGPTQRAILDFTSVTVRFTTVEIPRGSHRDKEPIETLFATMDIGIRSCNLVLQQQQVTLCITETGAQFVPQHVIVWVGLATSFNSLNLSVHSAVIRTLPNVIQRVTCRLNGNNSPDFMAVYQDHRINLQNSYQKSTMYNCFMSRVGMMPGRSRSGERTPAETEIKNYVGEGVAYPSSIVANAAIISTDPSAFLVREASSGLLTGRLDVTLTLDPATITNNHRVFYCCISKHQIGIVKVAEVGGASPQYEINLATTRPAYTDVQVQEAGGSSYM